MRRYSFAWLYMEKQLACEVHCTSMRYILMRISFVPRLRGTLEKHGIEQSGMFCRTDSKTDSHGFENEA